jgi:hypothetical protein
MRMASGIIVLTQESRFRLVDSEGRGRMFLLSHKASIEPQDLPQLQRTQAPVTVRYSEAPDLVADLAHDIYLTDEVSGDRA